jgi:hypothetical protein
MVLDTGRSVSGDPVTACKAEAAKIESSGALPGYKQISIKAQPLFNKAADWDYKYKGLGGMPMQARTRWFATNGKAYALSWSARQIDWIGDLSKINMIETTFYTDPVK